MYKQMATIGFTVLMMACGNNNTETTETTRDSATHDAHSTDTTQTSTGNPMMDMHDAMDRMMNQMKAMSLKGDADHDFAMMMKHHHQGAIEMAQIETASGTDATMKEKAQKMIDEQRAEIAVFDRVLQGPTTATNSDFGNKAMGMMTPMSEMKMEGGSLDAMFASMMVSHHQDAIRMAKEYLKTGKNEELRKVAQDIVESQQKEIKELQDWLATQKK